MVLVDPVTPACSLSIKPYHAFVPTALLMDSQRPCAHPRHACQMAVGRPPAGRGWREGGQRSYQSPKKCLSPHISASVMPAGVTAERRPAAPPAWSLMTDEGLVFAAPAASVTLCPLPHPCLCPRVILHCWEGGWYLFWILTLCW